MVRRNDTASDNDYGFEGIMKILVGGLCSEI